MNLLPCIILLFPSLITTINANTEKVIFLAPLRKQLASSFNIADRLQISALRSKETTVRASLPVAFPTTQTPQGLEHWYLLRQLNNGQRYEVRVCWAAIQPTEFWLDVLELDQIPDSLKAAHESGQESNSKSNAESVLALRIRAAADFFTSNQTLMRHPPPVDVDIILDPYVGNIFPASLIPTAVYITTLAIIGWFISGVVWSYLRSIFEPDKLHSD